MNKPQKIKHVPVLDDYKDSLSLYNLVGQDEAKKLLIIQIDQHYNDVRAGRTNKIPPILLIGKTASTVAKAYSNSFGNGLFFQMESSCLGFGKDVSEFLRQGDSNSTYYFNRAEDMSDWAVSELHRIIKERTIHVCSPLNPQNAKAYNHNRLMILSVREIDKLNVHLRKSIEICCRLKGYAQEEVREILNRYMHCAEIAVKDTSIFDMIAKLSECDIEFALTILKWAYRCCRAKDEEIMTVKHLNAALHMLENTM